MSSMQDTNFLEKCADVSQKIMGAYSTRLTCLKNMQHELEEERNEITKLAKEGNAINDKDLKGIIDVLESTNKNFDNAITVIEKATQDMFGTSIFIGNIYRNNLQNGFTSRLFDSMFLPIEKIFVQDCPLHVAILSDNYEEVVKLCESKEELKVKDPWGRNVLHLAISCSPKYFIENDLTTQDEKSFEKSKVVSHSNALKIIEMLLDYGLDPTSTDDLMQWNAFEYASAQNAFNALHLLCEKYPRCSITLDKNFCAFINVSLFWYPTNLISKVCLDENMICKALQFVNKYGGDRKVLSDVLEKFKADITLLKAHNFKNALHRAAMNGRADFMSLLISKGSLVNEINSEGETPLHLACANNQVECAKILLENGANASAIGKDHTTPLHNAADNLNILEMLLEYDSNVDLEALDVNGWTVLHHAIRNSNLDCVTFLVGEGSDITAVTDKKLSVLHIALNTKNFKMFDYLLNKAENIDFANGDGQTALICAIKNMSFDNAKAMIDKGASLSCVDEHGNSPLHLVAKIDHLTLFNQMLEKNPIIDGVNMYGQTALHLAVEGNAIRCVRTLLMKGADVNCRDKNNNTPLSISMKIGNPMVDLLIYNGANVKFLVNQHLCIAVENNHFDVLNLLHSKRVTAHKNDYASPLYDAMISGHLKCVQYLIKKDATLRCKMGYSNPFYRTAANGHEEVIKCVVDHKLDIDMVMGGDESALIFAVKHNQSDVVEMLIRQGAMINSTNYESPLMKAAYRGNEKIMKILINAGANVNYIYNNKTVLHHLIYSNDNVNCAKILIEHGANFSTVTSNGTPLQFARTHSRTKIYKYLIEMGAH